MDTAQTTVMRVATAALPSLASTTVIVPTTCVADRRVSLLNALQSAGEQSGIPTKILVVVNGPDFDPALLDSLLAREDLNVIALKNADLPGALLAGRRLVDTEYFCFLDDDDEILPNGLALRLQALRERRDVAFVATNGYYQREGIDQLGVANPEHVATDPLQAMTHECWLASCGGLYRTAMIDAALLSGLPRFLEWTYLGLRLASKRRMHFLDQPTFRVYDSPDSLSKSAGYRAGSVAAIHAALELELPPPVARRLRTRLSDAHHDLAEDHLNANEYRLAWKHHLTSLSQPGGTKYLLFSRHLLPLWPRSSRLRGTERPEASNPDNSARNRDESAQERTR
ncbi:MAG: glycosyltransferase family A protein [Burkholderiaceae bacterium]